MPKGDGFKWFSSMETSEEKYYVRVKGKKIRCSSKEEQDLIYKRYKSVGARASRHTETPNREEHSAEELRTMYEESRTTIRKWNPKGKGLQKPRK